VISNSANGFGAHGAAAHHEAAISKRYRTIRAARILTFLGAFALTLAQPSAQAAVPSITIGRPALIAPSDAEGAFPISNDGTSTATLGTGAPTAPEILDLAPALGNNVDAIYDFVRNYVDTVFIFGAQKGALGAVIDKSGTPFDQAQLMVYLLRQAGYTASYKVGTITLSAAEFAAWTNITNAQAACELLASGGIPATINGGSGSVQCSSITPGTTVSSVTMEHIWVSVHIGSNDYFFDPSYKPYDFSPQLNLASAAGFTSGQAYAAATTGQAGGADSGFNYVQNFNATSLNSRLSSYAAGLQSFIQNGTYTPVTPAGAPPAPLVSARIINLVGGREIRHDQVAVSGLRQTTLPYQGFSVTRTWTADPNTHVGGNIPDQFRTKLTVDVQKCLASDNPSTNGHYCDTHIITKDIYIDDVYGRTLVFDTNFVTHPPTSFQGNLLVADGLGNPAITLASSSTSDAPTLSHGTITLTVNHPYAADAAGSATAAGTYMDAVFTRKVQFATPFSIVHGWGDTSRGLIDRWKSPGDKGLPFQPPNGCETCTETYFESTGDGRRQQLAGSWLVQSSKAARLHASIANSIYTHHHSIGIVAGDTIISTIDTTPNGPQPHVYNYRVRENFDRVDIETGYSVTSVTGNLNDRRAAVHAIAATLDALEGSVAAQIADLPDTVSTTARFEWGNSPPNGIEDPSASSTTSIGARKFYDFNSSNAGSNANAITSLLLVEGKFTTTSSDTHGGSDPSIGPIETGARQRAVGSLIYNYASLSGWDVVASGEAFLGPGQRGGTFTSTGIGNTYTHNFTEQRGGAFIATRYSNGEPVQIAHIAANYDAVAGELVGIKGGGGGAQPNHNSMYDPSTAADILKSQFVDRSKAIGVDLDSGAVTYTSPATLKVGNGDFPFSLSANLIWRGGLPRSEAFGPLSHVEPNTPFTTNWNNTLTISGSGLEAMGENDIRATAGTVAAFMAMQDIYRQAVSPQREVAAVLAGAWWLHQIAGNVVTVNVGADTRQFVRKYDGSWFLPGAGAFASLTQTGQRAIQVPRYCTGAIPYVTTRGWDYSNVSFTVKNTHGDQQNFVFWGTNYEDHLANYCAFLHGFRMSSWTFPYGMSVNLLYQAPPGSLLDNLVQVNNSLGRQINFVDNGLGGFNNGLANADARAVQVTPSDITGTTTSVTHIDPAGVKTQINFGSHGGQWAITSVYSAVAPMGGTLPEPTTPVLAYTYGPIGSTGRLQTAQDAEALQRQDRNPYYFYFAEGARADRIDPSGAHYTVIDDIYRRPHWYYDELRRTTTAEHDGRGRVLSYLFPEQNKEVHTYDDHNNTTSLTRKAKPGSSLGDIPVSVTWDQTWNKPATITDAIGCVTTLAYYPSGAGTSLLQNATRCKPDPTQANPVYAFTYNGFGQPLQSTDPTGLVALNTYEPGNTGNLQSTAIDPAGVNSITRFTYYPGGLTSTIMDPRQYVTERVYDLDDRNTLVLHHNGDVSASLIASERTAFDTLGRILTKEGGIGFSGTSTTTWQTLEQMTYTPTGKLETDADSVGNTTRYFYDSMDRIQVVRDPVRRRVATVYDAAGQTLYTWRGWTSDTAPLASFAWSPASYQNGGPIRYGGYQYSPNGQQIQFIDANNNVTNLAYDGHDRLLYTLFADPAAQASTCTAAASPTANYDNPAQALNCSGAATYERYTYYADGAQQTLRKRDGQVINFSIDLLGRETVKHLPGTTTTEDVYVRYDLSGRPSYAHFGSVTGTGVDYGYDTAKRLTSESTFGRVMGYGYDLAGNRTKVTWPDNNFINYDFDGLNRAYQVRENGVTSGVGVLAIYGYDPLSHRTSITRGNGANTGYGYDPALRLSSLTQDVAGTAQDLALGFGYTLASQLQQRTISNSLYTWVPMTISKTYMIDALNRYSSVNGTSFSYDSRGNLTSDGTRSFSYDVENHLRSETGGAGLTLSYDPLGRLWQTVSGTTTTQFLYAGDSLVAEYAPGTSAPILRRYVHGPGVDEPIVWYEGSGMSDRRWLHSDERGSVIAKTDAAGAATVYTYGPYGEPSSWAGPRFTYTGQIALPEAQLYHYKARVYDPVLGRFLQTDPVGTKDDINLYAYVYNDPIGRADSTGTEGGCALAGGTCEDVFSSSSPGAAIAAGLDYLDQNLFIPLGPALGGLEHLAAVPIIAGVRALTEGAEGASAAGRAAAIAGTMSQRTQGSVTIAVTETAEGTRIVSSSEGALRPAARAALQSGEVAAKGEAGVHAEVNGINAAKAAGLTPTGTAASRPICPSCAATMKAQNVRPLSPVKKPPKASAAHGSTCKTGDSCTSGADVEFTN
jgi:RHS repeat-associated protein